MKATVNSGQFQPGQHWRPHQAFRDADWLRHEYLVVGRSAGDIARSFGVGDTAIHFWLKRHKIPTRSVSQARRLKHWGVEGERNPMFGRRGSANPNWQGGLSPLRQAFYASHEWLRVKRQVRKRDSACLFCGDAGRFHYHHIIPFSKAPLLALFVDNVCRLCVGCHRGIQRREMRFAKRLQRIVASKEEPVR